MAKRKQGDISKWFTKKPKEDEQDKSPTLSGLPVKERGKQTDNSDLPAGDSIEATTPSSTVNDSSEPISSTCSNDCRSQGLQLSEDLVLDMLHSCEFQEDHLHQYNLCKKAQCTDLSLHEKQRQSNLKDKFSHSRLQDKELSFCKSTGIWWLVFAEESGMYCLLCRIHDSINTQNKSKVFNSEPSHRFKISAISDHSKSKMHRSAIEAELTSRVSIFHKEVKEKEKASDDVLLSAFYAIYWLMKEEVASSKFRSLLLLVEKMGLTKMKYFSYTGAGTEREMFLLVGRTLKNKMLTDVQSVHSYGILADEVTDIAVVQQMVVFIQYVEPITCCAKVMFLDNINVLKNSTRADAETLYKCIIEVLSRNKLDVKNCTSLVTDGASVMVGKKSGVATRLKEDNPSLLSLHCICHRLALSCTDSNTSIKYICDVERILRQLWTFFENSPKRCATLTKIQLELHKIKRQEVPKDTRKALAKKVKKACSTRWLSFDNSVQSVYDEFVALTQTLRILKDDPTADGLLRKMNTVKFVGTIIILHHILPKLSSLSRSFQQGNINLSGIDSAISYTEDALDEIVKNEEPMKELQTDLNEGGRYDSLELTASSHQVTELKNLMGKYVRALKENIDNRFSVTLPVLSAFEVFNPMLVPERESLFFKDYGVNKVNVLAEHFAVSVENKADYIEEVKTSWNLFKYELLKFKHNVPTEILEGGKMTDTTPTQWTLQQFLANKISYQAFHHLLSYAEIFLSMPVSNAWPERGASAIKRIKTRLRSSLKEDMLQSLLQVNINGKKTEEAETDDVISQCVTNFKTEKQRRKLPNPKEKDNDVVKGNTEKIIEQEDVAVQVEFEEGDSELIRDKIQSISKLASLLGLNIDNDGESEIDSGNDDDYDEDDENYDF